MKSLCVVKLYEGNVCEESYEEKVLIKKRHVEVWNHIAQHKTILRNISLCQHMSASENMLYNRSHMFSIWNRIGQYESCDNIWNNIWNHTALN